MAAGPQNDNFIEQDNQIKTKLHKLINQAK
jgi:hypothetical protein